MKWISKPAQALQGDIELPGDKSLSHRTALFAALAQGISQIQNFQNSGVTRVLLTALQQMGISYQVQGTTLTLQSEGLTRWNDPEGIIDCGNSATTMRILAGALALSGVTGILDGSDRLRQRPMERIVSPLQRMGVPIKAEKGCAPLSIQCTTYPLHAIQYTLPVASAQVKTCLLLAALAADSPSTIFEPGPSRDHTERLMRQQGITVTQQTQTDNGQRVYQTTITPPQRLVFSSLDIRLPGDFSSAAFLIVAALVVPGSQIKLRNVGLNSTRTGLLDALLAMGADVRILSPQTWNGEPVGDLEVRHSQLKATQINGDQVVRMIDEFPIFAIAAACAQGRTRVSESEELRYKESDRIACLCNELRPLGVDIIEKEDGFEIDGSNSKLRGGHANSHNDHRLAMSFLTAGLAAADPVVVENAGIIAESFPEFATILNGLGATILKTEEV